MKQFCNTLDIFQAVMIVKPANSNGDTIKIPADYLTYKRWLKIKDG